MARTSIGLDIGTRAVRLAEVQMASGKPVVTRFGRVLLPIGAVDHGEIVDPQAVATAIQTLWKWLGLTGRSVHVGLANRRVVVRVIELPAMSKDDLAGAIKFQAQEHIPIPLDEAVMDFEVLEEIEKTDGESFQRVLVVAAERATVSQLLDAVNAANLEPVTLELNAYPLVRCFGNGSAAAGAIVDIGAGVTNVVVHHLGKIRFTRILPTFGGDDFTTAVAQALSIERDEAESLKREASNFLARRERQQVGAVTTTSSVAPLTASSLEATGTYGSDQQSSTSVEVSSGAPGDARPIRPRPRIAQRRFGEETQTEHGDMSRIEQAARAIDPLLDRLVTEVRGSIDFYSSQAGAAAVEHITLTGGGSLMGGISERLNASLGIAVEHGHPFERVPIARVEVSPQQRAIAEPFLGVAVGLALAGTER